MICDTLVANERFIDVQQTGLQYVAVRSVVIVKLCIAISVFIEF